MSETEPSGSTPAAFRHGEVAQTRAEIEQQRRALLMNEYQPVAVVGPEKGGKRPIAQGWQKSTGLPVWDPEAPNTGIICDGLRAIDVDVDGPDAPGIIALIQETLGPAPMRTRSNSSRALLLYRALEGAPRKRTLLLGTKLPHLSGRKQHVDKIEVLGRGQQFVAYGTHGTGVSLQWSNSSPLDTPWGDLTAVSEEQIEALFADISERFATPTLEATEAAHSKVAWEGPAPADCNKSAIRWPSDLEHQTFKRTHIRQP
jgi:hypothetical protein